MFGRGVGYTDYCSVGSENWWGMIGSIKGMVLMFRNNAWKQRHLSVAADTTWRAGGVGEGTAVRSFSTYRLMVELFLI